MKMRSYAFRRYQIVMVLLRDVGIRIDRAAAKSNVQCTYISVARLITDRFDVGRFDGLRSTMRRSSEKGRHRQAGGPSLGGNAIQRGAKSARPIASPYAKQNDAYCKASERQEVLRNHHGAPRQAQPRTRNRGGTRSPLR